MHGYESAFASADRQVQQLLRGRRHPSFLFHRTNSGHHGEFAAALLDGLHAEGFQPTIGLGLAWERGGRDVGYRTYGGPNGAKQRLIPGAGRKIGAALAPTRLHMEFQLTRVDERELPDGRVVAVPCATRVYSDRGIERLSLHQWQSPVAGEPPHLRGEPLAFAFEMQPPGAESAAAVPSTRSSDGIDADDPADVNAIRLWIVIGDVNAELWSIDPALLGRPQLDLILGEGPGPQPPPPPTAPPDTPSIA